MKIPEIKNYQDIYSWITSNIQYGYIDEDKQVYKTGDLSGIKKSYRTMSIEEILKYRVGTCVEQARLTQFLLNRIDGCNTLYCCRIFKTENLCFDESDDMHCFVLHDEHGKIIQLETSYFDIRGIYEFSSKEKAIIEISESVMKMRDGINYEIMEAYNIPDHCSYMELNKYLDDLIKVKV